MIVAARVSFYRCFRDTPEIDLDAKRVLITGKNNSGKTALLRVLSGRFENEPWSGALSEGEARPSVSSVEFKYRIESKSYLESVAERNSVIVPMRAVQGTEKAKLLQWKSDIEKKGSILLNFRVTPGGAVAAVDEYGAEFFDIWPKNQIVSMKLRKDETSGALRLVMESTSPDQNFALQICAAAMSSNFYLGAERLNVELSPVGPERLLRSNAENLPEVIQNIQANNVVYREYIEIVREILPEIREVSSVNTGDGRVKIRVSREQRPTEGDYIPLNACGSGVAQVLALSYVLCTASSGQTLLIEEPNNFLHPGAVRRLMSTIKRYNKNKFIISSHSPEVISGFEPDRIIRIVHNGRRSEIFVEDGIKVRALRDALSEVGARLSDVFGADQIVWVEGATEERAIPLLVDWLAGDRRTAGLVVRGVSSADELRSAADRKKILEIYNRLSAPSHLLPQTVKFVLDRETLTDAKVRELEKQSSGSIRFLPVRSYENFLLSEDVVAARLERIREDGFESTRKAVTQLFEASKSEPKYWKGLSDDDKRESDWRDKVDAAKLLKDVYWDLRQDEYVKTIEGYELTKIALERNPGLFDRLTALLKELIDFELVA